MNKSCKQHPTKQQLYDHPPPISKIIQIRWRRHAGEARLNSSAMFFCGPLYMDAPVLANQQELICLVGTLDAVWRTWLEPWVIGKDGERETEKSMLIVWLDNDDILYIYNIIIQLHCNSNVTNKDFIRSGIFWDLNIILGSIPGCVILKTLKMVLDTSLLNTQQYKVCIKGKVEQSRERSSTPPTPQCSSYRKGSLLVTLDYGR